MRRLQLRLLGLPGHFYDLPATTTYHLLRLTTSTARRDHMPKRTDPGAALWILQAWVSDTFEPSN